MKDMDKFIAQQRLLYPLSDESVRKLTEGMEEVFAPKGSFAVYEGDRDPYVWFVKEGLARSFVERDMRDVTLWFVSEVFVVKNQCLADHFFQRASLRPADRLLQFKTV